MGTPDTLHPLQLAWIVHGGAQCGFCTPGFIVSAKALLEETLDPTREEVRDWFHKYRNACRCTGYKPLVDAVMDAAKVIRGEMTLKSLMFKTARRRWIWGSRHPRPSAVAKVTGTLDYGADLGLKLPAGTLHLALVQAKVSHAKILSIETSAAEKMPGVFKVVTHKDIKGKNRITGSDHVSHQQGRRLGPSDPLRRESASSLVTPSPSSAPTQRPTPRAAAEKVKVDLEELPAYMSAPAAMADDAIEIHPGTPNVYFEQNRSKVTETTPIMASAAHTVEGEYYLQRQPHLTMEPDVGLAYFDDDGRLTIHSKSIAIFLHHAMISPGLGHRAGKAATRAESHGRDIRLQVQPHHGSAGGRRRMATGRPVFLKYNYFQHITYTGKRSPFFIKLKYGADDNGKIQAMEGDWIVDHGPYSEFGDLLTLRGSPVHRRRVRHSQHPRQRPDRVHQPCVGVGLPSRTGPRRASSPRKASWTSWR